MHTILNNLQAQSIDVVHEPEKALRNLQPTMIPFLNFVSQVFQQWIDLIDTRSDILNFKQKVDLTNQKLSLRTLYVGELWIPEETHDDFRQSLESR